MWRTSTIGVIQLFSWVADKDNLCLNGFPSGQWEVNLPPEEVPPEIPEPTLGINFATDGMVDRDWLASVSSYYAARFDFDSNDRKRLFNMMNELPTIFEVVVSGTAKKQVKERSAETNNTSSKSKSAGKSRTWDSPPKMAKLLQLKDEEEGQDEEEEEEDGATHCGSCGGVYTTGSSESSDFWIDCDVYEDDSIENV